MALFQLPLTVWTVASGGGKREPDVQIPAPSHSALTFQPCIASKAQAATVLAVTPKSAARGRRDGTAYLIWQPVYGNLQ